MDDRYHEASPMRRDTIAEPAGPPPASLLAAMVRGARGRCPACGSAPLFPRFLKPTLLCPACRQDWSYQRADDFPAYVVIFVTGHVILTLALVLEHVADPPTWVHLALWLPIATLLFIGLLQPVKGAIIAIQWWFGLHGFEPGSRRGAGSIHEKDEDHDRNEQK